MIEIIIGVLFLAWPLSKFPSLMKNKQENGSYFSRDKRILVPKFSNFGNGLNNDNIIGFSINVALGIILIVAGIFRLI